MKTLAQYINGNIHVTLKDDGTKIREYEGIPKPVHPESVDIKITDWCDAGCAFCHEMSTVKGKHAETDDIMRMVDGLPAGVELAVGGGDPLSHPEIIMIMQAFAKRGLVTNVTVNGKHVVRHADLIRRLRANNLIYGLGISYTNSLLEHDLEQTQILDSRTIIHFIAGEHQPMDAINFLKYHPHILVLGYKHFGRGLKHYTPAVDHKIRAWKFWITTLFDKGVICFDNLALEQLEIQSKLTPGMWIERFMGNDGQFTMYADAVKQEYAVSSTSKRESASSRSIVDYFQSIQS